MKQLRQIKERRKYTRYDTEAKVYFRVHYDIKTKLKFQIIDKGDVSSKKYPAISRNISAEGLGFSSNKKLNKRDMLYLEVYIPKQKVPIYMTGEVRWSQSTLEKRKCNYKFDTGVKLLSVSGKPVSETVYFDRKHKVCWSAVLDSVFGGFRRVMQKYIKKIKSNN